MSANIWIHGIGGRMGSLIAERLMSGTGLMLAGGSDRVFREPSADAGSKVTLELLSSALEKVDAVIDFSLPEAQETLLSAAEAQTRSKSFMVGTTGLTDSQKERWRELGAKHSVLLARNTSLGVLLLVKHAVASFEVLKDFGFDCEIIESHHREKVDAPSGTAKMIVDAMTQKDESYSMSTDRNKKRDTKEIGVQALRGGQVFGEHSIRFMGDLEELSISHKAHSRELFAQGAIVLTKWLLSRHTGAFQVEDVELDSIKNFR